MKGPWRLLVRLRSRLGAWWEAEPALAAACATSLATILADYGLNIQPGTLQLVLALLITGAASRRRTIPAPADLAKLARAERKKQAALRRMRLHDQECPE